MREDFEEELSSYKHRIAELEKQIELQLDKYRLLETYCDDLKNQMSILRQEH